MSPDIFVMRTKSYLYLKVYLDDVNMLNWVVRPTDLARVREIDYAG